MTHQKNQLQPEPQPEKPWFRPAGPSPAQSFIKLLLKFLSKWLFKGGFAADRIGRKRFIILSTIMLILITLGMTLLRNHGLAIYAAGRFLRMNFALQHIIGFQLCMAQGSFIIIMYGFQQTRMNQIPHVWIVSNIVWFEQTWTNNVKHE